MTFSANVKSDMSLFRFYVKSTYLPFRSVLTHKTHPNLCQELMPFNPPGLTEFFAVHSSSSSFASSPDALRRRLQKADPLHPDSPAKSHVGCLINDVAGSSSSASSSSAIQFRYHPPIEINLLSSPIRRSSDVDEGVIVISVLSVLTVIDALLAENIDDILDIG